MSKLDEFFQSSSFSAAQAQAIVDAIRYATGVSDGDKGDITVSGSGAVWTVDPKAITYAKIQDTASASVLIGRGSGAAGSVQELSGTNGVEISGTTVVINPASLNIYETSLSDLLDNYRLLLVDYVDLVGRVPDGLESEYQSALENM